MQTFLGSAIALGDGPLHAIREVVLHLARAPLLVPRVEEGLAQSRGCAEVHLEDGVAPVGEPLVLGVEAPGVPAPRPAVDVQHEGEVLGLEAHGQGQVGDEVHAVTGLDDDRLGLGEGVLLELGPVHEEEVGLLGLPVVEVVGRGPVLHRVGHDPMPVGAVAAAGIDHPAVDLGELVEVSLDRGIQDRPLGLHVLELNGLYHVPVGLDQHRAEVALGVLRDGLQLLARGRVHFHEARGVRAQGGLDEEGLAVGGEV